MAAQPAGWTVPRTPWGAPDLIGTYTNKTITPVQRPDDLADREFLSEDEIAALERERVERNEQLLRAPAERTTAGGNVGAYNNFWLDWGTKPTGRTSLIVDPPNGRIPPVTPEYKAHAEARAEDRMTRGELCREIRKAADISPAIVMMGAQISFYPPLFGAVVFLVAAMRSPTEPPRVRRE